MAEKQPTEAAPRPPAPPGDRPGRGAAGRRAGRDAGAALLRAPSARSWLSRHPGALCHREALACLLSEERLARLGSLLAFRCSHIPAENTLHSLACSAVHLGTSRLFSVTPCSAC